MIFVFLCEILTVVSKAEFLSRIPIAKKLLKEHTKDIPYFALTLYLNCPIRSNEKRFKEQSQIKVYPSHELKELF